MSPPPARARSRVAHVRASYMRACAWRVIRAGAKHGPRPTATLAHLRAVAAVALPIGRTKPPPLKATIFKHYFFVAAPVVVLARLRGLQSRVVREGRGVYERHVTEGRRCDTRVGKFV